MQTILIGSCVAMGLLFLVLFWSVYADNLDLRGREDISILGTNIISLVIVIYGLIVIAIGIFFIINNNQYVPIVTLVELVVVTSFFLLHKQKRIYAFIGVIGSIALSASIIKLLSDAYVAKNLL